ncbi:MAG: hypothetical protein IKA59_00875 [Clostridia bacterium]|nr:hypothetical protein [Clostridia bacterium]
MNEEQRKLCGEMLDILKEKGFCYTVIFTTGAIAFERSINEEESVERLKQIIAFAKESESESDFTNKISETYIRPFCID